jgi:hypothetical protein
MREVPPFVKSHHVCRHCEIVITGVVIDIQFPSYTVREGGGPVEVCAEITDGSLERMLTALLNTGSGTASG